MKAKSINFNREGNPYDKIGIGRGTMGIKKALLENPPPEVDSMEWDGSREWFEKSCPKEFLEDIDYVESDPLSPGDYYGFDDDYYLEENEDDIDPDEFHEDFESTGRRKSKPSPAGGTFFWQEGELPDGTKVVKYSVGLTSGYIAHQDWINPVNENFGGAGYAVYGGGGRGGYGNSYGRGAGFGQGQSNGGPNLMYTYTIKPLNQLLQQPGTPQGDERYIHPGSEIIGKILGKNKKIQGKVIGIKDDEDGNILHYIVQDQDTAEKFNIDPTSIDLINHEEIPNSSMMDFIANVDESFYPRLGEKKTLNEKLDFEREGDPLEKIRIGVKQEIRAELKDVEDKWRNLKDRARSRFHDPIDYPEEIKQKLARLSGLKADIKRRLDPEKARLADQKYFDSRDKKIKSNNSILRQIKKETIDQFPDIKLGEKIFSLYSYDKKKALKLLEDSPWENISKLRKYVIDARAFTTLRKKEEKATGYISW